MIDWISWTKCAGCGYSDKDVFQRPDDTPHLDPTPPAHCPQCGNTTMRITFPAFDIETIDMSQPSTMYDTIDDW